MVQSVLCHLATVLIEGLRARRHPLMLAPAAFVQQLVVSRYAPLLRGQMSPVETSAVSGGRIPAALAEADQVLDSVLPYFEELRAAMLDNGRSDGERTCTDYADAVVELVAAHLLELWAVQLVGAANVGHALSSCFPEAATGDASKT